MHSATLLGGLVGAAITAGTCYAMNAGPNMSVGDRQLPIFMALLGAIAGMMVGRSFGPGPSPSPQPARASTAERLAELDRLRDTGGLSRGEYESKRKEILADL